MPTLVRRLLLAAALLILLLAVALALLVALVDLNRFKPTLEARVAALTGRELTIAGEIGWSLYPVLGAELREVTLGNAPGFAGPMAQIERAALGVALLPLLRGELHVSEVVLERPRLALALDADGRNNWDDLRTALAGDEAPAADPAETGTEAADENQKESLAIAIEGVRISAGSVSWDDAAADRRARLDDLELRTGALGSGGPVPVQLRLTLLSDEPALRSAIDLSAEVSATADFARISWENLDLDATAAGAALPTGDATLRLRGSGSADLDAQRIDMPVLALELTTAEGDSAALGPVELDLKGALAADLAAELVTIEQLAVAATVAPGRDGIPAAPVALALDGSGRLDLAQQQLTLPALTARVEDLTLKATLEGRQIVDAPAFSGQLEAAPFALRPLLAKLGVEVPATSDPQALAQLALSSRFTASPERIALEGLQATLDDTHLTGRLAAGLGDVTQLEFALALDRLDLDRYLPPDEPAPAPTAPPPSDAPAPAPPPADDPFTWMDGLALDGSLKAGQLAVAGLTLRDVAATLRLRDRVFSADPLRAQLYGGAQQVALRLDARGAEPLTQLRIDLQSVALEALLADLMEQAPLRGTAALNADLRLQGLEAERIKQTLSGSGRLVVRDGAVKGFNVAQELRNAVALLRGQPRSQAVAETDFTELTLDFTATDGVIRWPALAAQSPLLRLASQGSLDLGRDRLDARLDANIVKTLKGQGGEPLEELAGFNVPIELRGALSEPKLSVDVKGVLAQTRLGDKQAELEQKVEERKEELRGKAAEELQRGLNRLLKSRDRDPAPADAAGTAPAGESQ